MASPETLRYTVDGTANTYPLFVVSILTQGLHDCVLLYLMRMYAHMGVVSTM